MSAQLRKKLEAKLDPRQRRAALAVVERDFLPKEERKTYIEIAEEIGVDRDTLYRWRTQNTAFIQYMELLADEYLRASASTVYAKLLSLIDTTQPSVKAIDLWLRKHGKLTERQVIESVDGNGGSREAADIQAELDDLDELLKDGSD